MVSAKAYAALITKFLDKWEKVLSKTMINSIKNVYEWVLGYEANSKTSAAERIPYMKRGANLMKLFVRQYDADMKDMEDKLSKCRMALLKGDKPLLLPWCTNETRDLLASSISDLNRFTYEMIGCAEGANNFFLHALKNSVRILGDDYIKIKNDMELTCIHLQILILRN